MTWQPAPSIPLASQSSSWRRPVSCQFIPGRCPPISFSVCLVFSLLALCPAGLSWQALKILLCARTISICVVLLWSRGLRVAQLLAEFCFAPLCLRCGLCRWCRGAFWGISSPWPVIFSLCLLLVSETHRHTGRNMDMSFFLQSDSGHTATVWVEAYSSNCSRSPAACGCHNISVSAGNLVFRGDSRQQLVDRGFLIWELIDKFKHRERLGTRL